MTDKDVEEESDDPPAWIDSADKDLWETPEWLLDVLERHIEIEIDPCAGAETEIGSERNVRPPEDGLSVPWDGAAFVNPPFSEKDKWVQKAAREVASGRSSLVIFLSPDSTDVRGFWHGSTSATESGLADVAPYCWFSDGRISYRDPETGEPGPSPTFGTALNFVADRPLAVPPGLLAELDDCGDVLVRWDALRPNGVDAQTELSEWGGGSDP